MRRAKILLGLATTTLTTAMMTTGGCAANAPDAGGTRESESSPSSLFFVLEPKHSGKALDVAGGSTADGANVQQWEKNGTDAQRWSFEPAGGGFYVIRSKVSGKVLDVQNQSTNEGANVQQWTYWGGANQQWALDDAGDGYFFVRGRQSGMYLDVAWASTANGANVAQVRFYGSDAQKWRLRGNEPAAGDYTIRPEHSGKCLDVPGSSHDDGAKLWQWPCNGTDAQRFHLVPLGGTVYEIVNAGSGKALDVTDVSTAPGARLQQWSYGGGENQKFDLVPLPDGAFELRALHSGLVLDVGGASPDDGAPVIQWTANGGANQHWRLVPAGASAPSNAGGGTSTPTPTPTPPPAPPPPSTGPLPTRLRITNNCAAPIWIAHSDNVQDPQNIQLARGQSHDYAIPDGGLSSTRFWPKTGCDASGHGCTVGDSGEGGGKPCPATGCQPPVDSKFEASFAAKGSGAQTWYNLSQVDGYTLPFKVVPRGTGAEQGSCVTSDCSGLSLDRCPGGEDMSGGGRYPAYGNEDLRVRDGAGNVIACMAPCKKWNYPAPWGLGQSERDDPGLHMCCPTPIDPSTGQCTIANGCMTSQACSDAGDPVSVVHTSYVAALRSMCPSAYSYAYDDHAGLHACSSETGFEVTFCP